jgi:outer membrane protein OmpA-like peptidoglycan-associated protein
MSNEWMKMISARNSRRLASALLWITMATAGVAQAQTSAKTVDGFPQYGVAFSDAQRGQLRDVARFAADALVAGRPVMVLVVGHADKDAGGETKEMEVSTERAQAGGHEIGEAIRKELRARGIDAALADSVDISVNAVGHNNPKVEGAVEESDRKKNRRVEFTASLG